ncbi:hypothetical protein QE400_003664 [Xanthomonas sacchari]|uniref:DUF6988 family protein n=1 Tax=Xanthomonas sacchari TaxID=56458 RepID=UPI00278A4C99|nr:hypothetical protein [Xanthomonas sacchari]MDQ1094251.1 hypothetical protein [Xanthomonas sacchari]
MTTDIAVLLDRSDIFHNALRITLQGEIERAISPGARTNAAFSYGRIALEHGSAFQHLLSVDNPTSAMAIVRLQYEAVLRGSWAFYAAPDQWIDSFGSQPGSNSRKEPVEFPKVYKMLEELAASPAEPVLAQSLSSLKERAWDALNSYTHGGLRLMVRSLDGFEPELLAWMLRTTNSLCYIAAQLIAHVANDPARSNQLLTTRNAMSDCMHKG